MSCIRVVIALFLSNSFLLLTAGCNPDSGSPTGVSPHADTSKFIGTWVTVFDTSDNPPGTKDDKIMFWCLGGKCGESDTFNFVNDTLYNTYESGFEYSYKYTDDSIYFYAKIVGTNQKDLVNATPYYLSNDTLLLDYDTMNIGGKMYINRVVNIRISNNPLPFE